jgi:hypothetical protein
VGGTDHTGAAGTVRRHRQGVKLPAATGEAVQRRPPAMKTLRPARTSEETNARNKSAMRRLDAGG